MATFIKLSNGDVVNTEHIKSIKRHEYSSPADWVTAMQRSRLGPEKGPHLQTTPSIQLQLGSDPNPLLLKYESEQKRDAEFERIESLLIGRPLVLFSNLALNPALIESLQVEWASRTDDSLRLRIKATGMDTYTIEIPAVDEEDWLRAHELIAQFGLTVPKTFAQRQAEMWERDS